MKKHFLKISTAVMVACSIPCAVSGQKKAMQIVPTAGVGYSITGALMGFISNGLNAVDVESSKTPVIIGGADFAVTDIFSVGGIYTYQGLTVKYNSYQVEDTAGNMITITGDFKDVLSRQSVGVRSLFHFGQNEDFDLYSGARFSYVWWNYNGREDFDASMLSFGSPVKVQALFGMRYFFIPNLGIGMEFAVGATYFMSFGLNGRFGGI
ncbi:MAG TPA: hypothetical protein VI731_04995 [Bacteroidia bacterium]|nr:hypothetical protein [Bacteroidia bacterium]